MSVLAPSHRFSVAIRLLVVSSIVLIAAVAGSAIQPPHAGAGVSTRLSPKPQDGDKMLAGGTRISLSSLLSRLRAGEEFSAEEEDVLIRYGQGEQIVEIEAQTVISRALYEYYVKANELTPDQHRLLREYLEFISPRKINAADRKGRNGVLERREPERAPHVPPTNDLCAGAEVIPPAGPFPYLTAVTADITDATTTGDPSVPTCQANVSRSIWYTFTPATTGNYTISSCTDAPTGTTVDDTVFVVYTATGSCTGFTPISCSDSDGCTNEANQETLTLSLTAGQLYYILVWKFDTPAPVAGSTAVQLRVTVAVPPVNDTCAGALPLTLGIPAAGAITAVTTNDYTLTGTTCYTGLSQTTNAAAGRDVVYSFTPPSTGTYSFILQNSTVTGTATNPILYLSTTCPGPGALACNLMTVLNASNRNTTAAGGSESINCVTLTGGVTYYLFVDALNVSTGAFTLEARSCVVETEANDTPATANVIMCGIQGTTSASATDFDFYSIGTSAAGSRVFAMADGGSALTTPNFDMRITTTVDTLEFDNGDNVIPFGSSSPNIAGRALTGVASFIRINNPTQTTEPYRLYSVIQPPGSGLGGTSASPEVEPNDSLVTATTAPNNFFSGSLASTSEFDLYSFTATAGDVVFISLDSDPLRNLTPVDAILLLGDSTGTVVVGVDDVTTTSSNTTGAGSLTAVTPNSPAEALVYTIQTSGTYYVQVALFAAPSPAGSGDYLLSIAKTCAIPMPDVAISKSGPPTIACNGTITYTLTASNLSSVDATNAMVTDDLPDCLTGVMVTSTAGTFGVGAGNVVTGTIPTLSSATPVTITITGVVPGACGASISNQASISAAGDATPANNTSATVMTTVTTTSSCSLLPATDTNPILTSHTVTATVLVCGAPQVGQTVNFAVTGRNTTTGSGTTDGLGQVAFTYTDTGSAFAGGTDTITATVVSSGSMCTATKDWIAAPCVLTCPANITQPNTAGTCSRVVTFAAPTSTGDCGTITCVPSSGSSFPVGTTTVTCTSQAGTNCSFTVTIQDTEAPTVTCPANITQPNTAGTCGRVVTYTTPTGIDNCPGVVTVNCVPASGSTFPVGTTTVTCTANDVSPDSPAGTCTFTVTIQDTQAPTVTCPANISVVESSPGSGSATVTYTTPTASDNCPGATVNCVPASGSTFPVGTTTVTCTATDASANTGACTFTVMVTMGCTITCPANMTVPNTTGQCSAVVTYPPPTATGCGTVTCTPASGATFAVGTTTVNCSTTAGPSCSFTVTVQDTQAPSVTCPANITVPNAVGQCSAAVSFSVSATDNCVAPTIVCMPASGSTFPVGTTSVTCTASDSSPNSPDSTCTFSVTVQDTQAPAITCPANMTVPKTPGQCSTAVSYTVPTPTDNCPGATASCTPASGSTFNVGSTTVTCTAVDASPNSPDATCTFTITVTDTTAPTITCPANVTVGNDANVCFGTVSYTAPTTTDNCPGTSVTCTPASGTQFAIGATTVTCTATDASNNTSTCSFTVTVNDLQSPVATCPAPITTAAATGTCAAVVNYTASASDNCPGATIVCAPASGSSFPVGTTTVNCTATDASGNMGTCAFTVTVQDTQVPVITCPSNIVVTSTTTTGCTFTSVVNYPAPTATDNCGLASVTCVPPSGSTFNEGTTTVVCTATDTSGNTAACTFTVTVGASFGFCAVDDATGDTFRMVVNPASPSYRVWRYTMVATGTTYCGRANSLNYVPGVRLIAYDNDYSVENPTFFMDANFKGNSGTVTVRNVSGTIRKTLRDRNLLDSVCP